MVLIQPVWNDGQEGQFRANESQIGWRGGGRTVLYPGDTIKQVEWLKGSLRLLCETDDGTTIVTFDGFAPNNLDEIQQHFLNSFGVDVKNHDDVRVRMHDSQEVKNSPNFEAVCGPITIEDSPEQTSESKVATDVSKAIVVPTQSSAATEGDARRGVIHRPATLVRSDPDSDSDVAAQTHDDSYGHVLMATQQDYSESLVEGWVWKQSRHMKRWRRRYAVLTPKLFCTMKDRKGTPTLVFENISNVHMASNHEHAFVFSTTGTVVTMICESDAQRDAWIRFVKQTCVKGSGEPAEARPRVVTEEADTKGWSSVKERLPSLKDRLPNRESLKERLPNLRDVRFGRRSQRASD